jgi:hypothetical protein
MWRAKQSLGECCISAFRIVTYNSLNVNKPSPDRCPVDSGIILTAVMPLLKFCRMLSACFGRDPAFEEGKVWFKYVGMGADFNSIGIDSLTALVTFSFQAAP